MLFPKLQRSGSSQAWLDSAAHTHITLDACSKPGTEAFWRKINPLNRAREKKQDAVDQVLFGAGQDQKRSRLLRVMNPEAVQTGVLLYDQSFT